ALASLLTRLFPGLAPGEPTALLPALGSRLSYPLGYWNGLAVFAALAMPLLLGTATSSRSRYPALSLAAVPTLASVIVLASSRGGMLTAGAALVAFAALSRRRARALAAVVVAAGAAGAAFAILHQRPHLLDAPKAAAAVGEGRSAALLLLALSIATPLGFFVLGRGFEKVAGMPALRRRSVRAGLLAAVAALALAAIALAHPVARWNDFTRAPSLTESRQPAYVQRHLLSDSGSGRWQMWRAAVDEFRSRPLLGRGAGSFEQWWTQRRPLALTTRDAHSLYLEAAAETGLLGSIPLAALLVAAGLTLGRRLRRLRGGERELAAALGALLVAYAVAAGIDWMWEMTVVSAIAFVALGLVAGPGVSGADLRVVRAPSRRLSRVSLVLGSILVGWVLLCAQAIPFFAQSRLRASADAARAGNTRTALTAARQAQRIEPWASSPRLQEALVHEAAGRLRPAQQEIQAAIRRDPDDWRLWLVATRIAVKRAQPVRANVALARVRALNPLLEVALTG
ncbi:MAG: O-antigen ligase family protein, partial [Gaiellaceae bacterium]